MVTGRQVSPDLKTICNSGGGAWKLVLNLLSNSTAILFRHGFPLFFRRIIANIFRGELTPWSMVLLEKVSQLIKKFPGI
jgi:hypothetical protein